MLKNILKLEGTQKLTKNEQKSINGGKLPIVCEDFSGLGDGVYPVNQTACSYGFVFRLNYYGNGMSACCSY